MHVCGCICQSYTLQLMINPGRQHDAGHNGPQQKDDRVDGSGHCGVPAAKTAAAHQTWNLKQTPHLRQTPLAFEEQVAELSPSNLNEKQKSDCNYVLLGKLAKHVHLIHLHVKLNTIHRIPDRSAQKRSCNALALKSAAAVLFLMPLLGLCEWSWALRRCV